MKITTKLELRLDEYEKILSLVDHDCPLGQIFDYACALQHFALQQMKEDQEKKEAQKKALEQEKPPEEGVTWE